MTNRRRLAITTWLLSALMLAATTPAQVPDIPPNAPDGRMKDIAVRVTPMLRAMDLYGPWEPGVDEVVRSTWRFRGGQSMRADLQFGHPDRTVERAMPQYVVRRGPAGLAWERIEDKVVRHGLRGGIEIRVWSRAEGSDIALDGESTVRELDARFAADLGDPPRLVGRVTPARHWREYRALTILDEPAAVTRSGRSPHIAQWAVTDRGGLYRVVGPSLLERVDLKVRAENPPIAIAIVTRNRDGAPEDESLAIQIAERILLAARGNATPTAPAPEPAEPEPEADAAPVPEPVPDPAPVPPPAPDIREPDRPSDPASERIDAMDAAMAGVEDVLQSSLIAIQILTNEKGKRRAEMRRLSAATARAGDDGERRTLQEKVRALLAELRQMADIEQRFRQRALDAMTASLAEVERIEAEYGFGPLEMAAALRVEAARARMALLRAQLDLAAGDWDGAQAAAQKIRAMPALGGTAYWVEGMAHLGANDLGAALDSFRIANRLGYEPPRGSTFEALIRDTEIGVLRALQSRVTGDAARFHDQFETWIAAKAETSANPNQSRFGTWFERIVWRGWYDTISGTLTGGRGAEARADDVALVADEATLTQFGLNLVAGLRRDHSLQAIQAMGRADFETSVRARWGDDAFDEHEMAAMRAAVVRAMRMDDVQHLMDGTLLEASELLTRDTVQQIGVGRQWGVDEKYWELGAAGGNMVNGWTVFTTFAGGARLKLERPWLRGAGEYKQVATLHEWFAASKPLQSAAAQMQKIPGGTQFIESMAQAHHWSQRSMAHGLAMGSAQIVGMGVTSYAAKAKLGEDAALVLDFLSILGVDSPQFYDELMKGGLGASRAVRASRSLGRAATEARTRASSMNGVAERVRVVVRDGAPPPAVASIRREIAAATDGVSTPAASRLEAAVDLAVHGEPAAATRMLDDFERAQAAALREADQLDAAASRLDDLADRLPEPKPDPGLEVMEQSRRARSGDLDESAGTVRPGDEPAGTVRPGDEPAGTVRPGDEPAGTVRPGDEPAGTVRPGDEPAGTVRPGSEPPGTATGGDATAQPGASSASSTDPGYPSRTRTSDGTAKVYPDDASSPLARADDLLADGRAHEAAIEYQRIRAGLDPTDPLAREVDNLIDQAVAMEREIQRRARVRAESTPDDPPPDIFGDAAARSALEDAARYGDFDVAPAQRLGEPPPERVTIRQPNEPHLVAVKDVDGSTPTASAPRYAVDGDGNPIAVVKNRVGSAKMGRHDEGAAEELASRLSEALGRRTPKARVETLPGPDGSTREMIVSELLPDGRPLQDVLPDHARSGGTSMRHRDARLLAIKDELTEDLAFSLLMGDGDRHFGNIWITESGEVIGFDYGLADIFPEHVYRKPGGHSGVNRLYHTAPEVPPRPGTMTFDNFVRETSSKHLEYATRGWRNGDGVLHSALRRGDLKKHITRMREKLLARLPNGRTPLDDVIDTTFANHPHKEYVRAVLERRLELLAGVVDGHFNRAAAGGPQISRAELVPEGRWAA